MVPAIAAGVAAGAQLLGSWLGSKSEKEAREYEAQLREQARQDLQAQASRTDQDYLGLRNDISRYYKNRGSLGQRSDIQSYRDAIAGYDPTAFIDGYDSATGQIKERSFDDEYDKTREDFLNPYYSAIIGDTANQIQHTAAGAGLGRGTGAALNIAKGVAEKSDELNRTANEEFNQDRNFVYQKYQDALKNNQAKLDALRTGTENKINMTGNLASDYLGTQDASMQSQLQAEQDRMNARVGYASAISGLY